MTLAELKTRIAQILHRADLSDQMDNFISDAQYKIERRFGIDLDLSSGDVPADTESLFLYSALQSAYEFLNNGDNAQYYYDRFELESDRQNVLQPGTVTDNFALEPPYIKGDL